MANIDNLNFYTQTVQNAPQEDASTEHTTTPRQVLPGASILELAQSEMSAFGREGLDETLENLSFALGSRLQDQRAADAKAEVQRARGMLYQLINQVTAVAPTQLDELLASFSHLATADDPWAELKRAGLDAGKMALVLASLLSNGKNLSSAQRKRLEEALALAMEEEGWELMLFTQLEFGPASSAALQQLKQLYQRASARHTKLVQWFNEFRHMKDRKRKLKTLIRTLAFELAAQGPSMMKNHLAAVITDLKRIVQFFGLEDHCNLVANAVAYPTIDGDRVMTELLEIVDQSWIFPDWLESRVAQLGLDGPPRYGYTRRLNELLKLLPDECFREEGQRDMIVKAFSEYLEKLADDE